MYTDYGNHIMARAISAERTGGNRESIVLANPNVFITTVTNSVSRFVKSFELPRLPRSIQQVACTEVPQYC